jgi:hypothetical protein
VAAPIVAARRGAVAQLGERDVRNVEVRGSIPLCSTSSTKGLAVRGFVLGIWISRDWREMRDREAGTRSDMATRIVLNDAPPFTCEVCDGSRWTLRQMGGPTGSSPDNGSSRWSDGVCLEGSCEWSADVYSSRWSVGDYSISVYVTGRSQWLAGAYLECSKCGWIAFRGQHCGESGLLEQQTLRGDREERMSYAAKRVALKDLILSEVDQHGPLTFHEIAARLQKRPGIRGALQSLSIDGMLIRREDARYERSRVSAQRRSESWVDELPCYRERVGCELLSLFPADRPLHIREIRLLLHGGSVGAVLSDLVRRRLIVRPKKGFYCRSGADIAPENLLRGIAAEIFALMEDGKVWTRDQLIAHVRRTLTGVSLAIEHLFEDGLIERLGSYSYRVPSEVLERRKRSAP